MADEKHLKILRQGVEVWDRWREENPDVKPDLREADLSGAILFGANLSKVDLHAAFLRAAILHGVGLSEADLRGAKLGGADLSMANLRKADLRGAYLHKADLRAGGLRGAKLSEADLGGADLSGADFSKADLHGANLIGANLIRANLIRANLIGANLIRADLHGANLHGANLSGADLSAAYLRKTDLSGANLSGAVLDGAYLIGANLVGANLIRSDLMLATFVRTNLAEVDLTGCSVYGISAWELNLEGAKQSDLVISYLDEPVITVDNLEVAQFIYLLLHNEKIRDIIDTITSKAVLILGRFTPERKQILDAIRDELRQRDYLPVLFDFDPPSSRDLTETISILARMSRFIIADITDPKSIPHELREIIPNLPSVPVQPLIASSDYEYGMFEHFRRYPWVLDTYQYDSLDELLDTLEERVIDPAEMKAKELIRLRDPKAEEE